MKLCDTLKAVDSYVVDGECWDSVLHSGAKRSLAYSNVGLPPVDDYVCPWCKVPDTAQPPLPALASGAAPAARIPSPSGLLQDLIAKIDAAIKKAKTLKPEEQAFCKVQESLTALDLLVKGEMTYAAALVAPELVRVLNCYLASDISDHAWAQAELLYKKQCYWGAGDVSEAGVCTDADRAILRTWYWQQTGTLLLAPVSMGVGVVMVVQSCCNNGFVPLPAQWLGLAALLPCYSLWPTSHYLHSPPALRAV